MKDKGQIPVPYMIAFLIGIAVVAVLGYYFFVTLPSKLPNPAAVFCEERGGRYMYMKIENADDIPFCQFEDRMCEAWEYFYSDGETCMPFSPPITPMEPDNDTVVFN